MKLNINELRVGSLIRNISTNTFETVEDIQTYDWECTPINRVDIIDWEGVELTYELLIRNGFVDEFNQRWGCRIYLDTTREIFFDNNPYVMVDCLIRYQSRLDASFHWTTQFPKIKYYHQLQNLFFVLTGKELTTL